MKSVVFQTAFMLQCCYCLREGMETGVGPQYRWDLDGHWKLEEEVRYSHSQVDAGIQCVSFPGKPPSSSCKAHGGE